MLLLGGEVPIAVMNVTLAYANLTALNKHATTLNQHALKAIGSGERYLKGNAKDCDAN